jgi:hypothetical protein
MKRLRQRYVQYINRTYRRSGTLWEGRFRSCLTQEEDYVPALSRCQRTEIYRIKLEYKTALRSVGCGEERTAPTSGWAASPGAVRKLTAPYETAASPGAVRKLTAPYETSIDLDSYEAP